MTSRFWAKHERPVFHFSFDIFHSVISRRELTSWKQEQTGE
jgi:hypothetical protein